MALISLHSINIAFNGPKLLDDVSLDIEKGQRICILGRNGAGKTTLLRIINKELKPDSGEIIYEPSIRIARLSQDVPDGFPGTVFEIVASAVGPSGEIAARYHRACNEPTDSELLHELQHDMAEHECWKIESAVKRIVTQVQVAPDLSFSSLSGGMRRRVLLAAALVRDPDVLVLDEPTNHLDLASIAWLEDFIISSRLTVIFVTHDRRLIRKIATRIVEIDRGAIYDWSCDYPAFLERKQALLENEEKAWALFDKRLAQEEIWIRQGVKARRTRSEGRVKALLKMREERRKKRDRTGQVTMAINSGARSGEKVLEVRDLSFAYADRPVISGLSLLVSRGDRIGIVGPNGCGKTTLLALMLGKLMPQRGSVEIGSNVLPLYFDQLRKGVDLEKTVWENLCPEGSDTVFINGKPRHVISYLQDFLFTSERARTLVKLLSGGERHRLLLAKLFIAPSNLLVFDEPTNDLDTETLELLEEVLLEYQGTFLVVSHDREFLNNVVTSILAFGENGKVNEFVGGYDDWERQCAQRVESSRPEKPSRKDKRMPAPVKTVPRRPSQKERLEMDGLPVRLEALEKEQADINIQLADYTACQKPGFVSQSKSRLAEIESEIAVIYSRWEELDRLAKDSIIVP